MDAEKTRDDRCTVRSEEPPSRIPLNELGKLENLGDSGHASILNDDTDINRREQTSAHTDAVTR